MNKLEVSKDIRASKTRKTEEHKAEIKRIYREAHKEQAKEYWHKYYAKNRDKLIEKNKRYMESQKSKDPELFKEKNRQRYKKKMQNQIKIDGHYIDFWYKRWVKNKEERERKKKIKKPYNKEYYLQHKEIIDKANRKYRYMHPERVRETLKKYYDTNREKINEARKIRYIKRKYIKRQEEISMEKMWNWLKWRSKIAKYKFNKNKCS